MCLVMLQSCNLSEFFHVVYVAAGIVTTFLFRNIYCWCTAEMSFLLFWLALYLGLGF